MFQTHTKHLYLKNVAHHSILKLLMGPVLLYQYALYSFLNTFKLSVLALHFNFIGNMRSFIEIVCVWYKYIKPNICYNPKSVHG